METTMNALLISSQLFTMDTLQVHILKLIAVFHYFLTFLTYIWLTDTFAYIINLQLILICFVLLLETD